jgi:hypothetical protein
MNLPAIMMNYCFYGNCLRLETMELQRSVPSEENHVHIRYDACKCVPFPLAVFASIQAERRQRLK